MSRPIDWIKHWGKKFRHLYPSTSMYPSDKTFSK